MNRGEVSPPRARRRNGLNPGGVGVGGRQATRASFHSRNFLIYLSALICFVLAAMGEGWRFGGRTRAGLAPRVVLVPLGLALYVLPTVIAYGRGF